MIRKQDATATIVDIASNVVGQSLAWDFVRARWSYIFSQWVQHDNSKKAPEFHFRKDSF